MIPSGITMTETWVKRQNIKNAQLRFAQKTLRLTKTIRMILGSLRLK
jgi:hypothetical protein